MSWSHLWRTDAPIFPAVARCLLAFPLAPHPHSRSSSPSVPAADASVRLYTVTAYSPSPSGGVSPPVLTPRVDFAHTHDAGINDLVFTHDDKCILTASDDKTIILWSLDLQRPLKTFKGHTNYVFCLAVNAGGDACVSGSYDETLRIWDMKNARCTRVICAHSDPISAVDYNKTGTLIVSSSYDGLCRVWDAQTGRCLKTIYNENTPPVSVAGTPSEEERARERTKRVGMSGAMRIVLACRSRSHRLRLPWPCPALPSPPPSSFVRFSPNCKYLLVSSLDSTLRLWDYSSKESVTRRQRLMHSGGASEMVLGCPQDGGITTAPARLVAR